MLLDFVNEVQVKSSGYAAEYGGATGGVVNILTKSGSNQFHGQAGTYYQNDSFYGDRRPSVRFSPYTTSDFSTRQTGMLAPDTPWTYWSPLGDFGGPVLHDKLWFYAGVGYTKNNFNRDATFITDPSKTVRHFDVVERLEVLQLQRQLPAFEQSPCEVLRVEPARWQPGNRAHPRTRQRRIDTRQRHGRHLSERRGQQGHDANRHVRQERGRIDQPGRVRRAVAEAGRQRHQRHLHRATWTGSSSRRSSSTCRAARSGRTTRLLRSSAATRSSTPSAARTATRR